MNRRLFKWLALPMVLSVILCGWLGSRKLSESPSATTSAQTPRQWWTCSMHPQVISEQPGQCPICHMKLTPLNAPVRAVEVADTHRPADPEHRTIKYWWDPMIGPSSIRDHPGKSAMGMDLVPVYAEPSSTTGEITVDPATVQNMGIQLAAVTRGPLVKTVRAVGYLQIADPLRYDISPRISGWIENLSANTPGMRIAKGQKLFDLYSPQLTVAVNELIAARAAGEANNPIYAAARQKLLLWGLPPDQVDQLASLKTAPATIPFFSPAAGVLTETDVVQGSAIQAAQRIMRIVDQHTLWLEAQVYPQDMSWIHPEMSAVAAIQGMPGESWRGKVIFIDPKVNPATRTTSVRVVLDNPRLKLHPGMFAAVQLTTQAMQNVLLVPQSAVIDTGLRQVAFVATGNGHFRPHEVKTGLVGSDGHVQVLSGLSADDQVVVTGQFLLDAESQMQEAMRRYQEPNNASAGSGQSHSAASLHQSSPSSHD